MGNGNNKEWEKAKKEWGIEECSGIRELNKTRPGRYLVPSRAMDSLEESREATSSLEKVGLSTYLMSSREGSMI
jgi:hypothetical protein